MVMPYQLNGQLVTRKSHRLLQEAGAVTAVGGGAFVTMSAAVAAVSDTAMSDVEMPAMLSEVRSMVILLKGNSLYWEHFCSVSQLREVLKVTFTSLFYE